MLLGHFMPAEVTHLAEYMFVYVAWFAAWDRILGSRSPMARLTGDHCHRHPAEIFCCDACLRAAAIGIGTCLLAVIIKHYLS
jgi:hypothetical protein